MKGIKRTKIFTAKGIARKAEITFVDIIDNVKNSYFEVVYGSTVKNSKTIDSGTFDHSDDAYNFVMNYVRFGRESSYLPAEREIKLTKRPFKHSGRLKGE